jgi:hypothetical protein
MSSHCSGQITKTVVLSYTTAKYRRGKFTPCESDVKTEQAPVLDGLLDSITLTLIPLALAIFGSHNFKAIMKFEKFKKKN